MPLLITLSSLLCTEDGGKYGRTDSGGQLMAIFEKVAVAVAQGRRGR